MQDEQRIPDVDESVGPVILECLNPESIFTKIENKRHCVKNRILYELRNHAPFTAIGALSGIALMFFLQGLKTKTALDIFYIFHPLHVLLSAMVTASLYTIYMRRETGRVSIVKLILIGYVGSVGIATLSDSLIPFLGEWLLNMPNRHVHIGFIEKWWLIIPLALVGIAIAYFKPSTKFPHYAHVFLSTWASLFHILMARGGDLHWSAYIAVFGFLFIAVWLPCCISDIVFPLLFVKNRKK